MEISVDMEIDKPMICVVHLAHVAVILCVYLCCARRCER